MFRYTTPLGSFKTATEAAKAHNMTQPGIFRRFRSSNWADYIDNNNKVKNQVYVVGKNRLGKTGEKMDEQRLIQHKIAMSNRTWKVEDSSNMGVHCRIAIVTPQGDFESFTAAAEAYNVTKQTISNWVYKEKFAHKGFSIKNVF